MIVKNSDKLFNKNLILFEKNYHFTPAYTKNNINFRKQSFLDKKSKNQNKSFIITENFKPVILFFGYIVKSIKNELHTFDHPCLLIQLSKVSETNKLKFYTEIQNIFKKINGNTWIKSNTKLLYSNKIFNNFTKLTSNHLIIDLKNDDKILWKDLRKSYKPLINKGKKIIKYEIYNKKNISWEIMLEFQKLHILDAGRKTRSDKSWYKQFEIIKKGEGFLILGYFEQQLIAASFFTYTKFKCAYATSATNKKFFHLPLNHAAIWKAIIFSKNLKCEYFDFGPINILSEKNQFSNNFDRFKSGFGGISQNFFEVKKNFR